MCTVQVLLFADIMRRTDVSYNNNNNNAGLPRSICRRLFADDSPQSRPSRLLKTLQADLEKGVKERWNFDFRTGTPLPGRYQWVAVRPGVVEQRVPPSDSVVTEVPQTTTDTTCTTEKRPGFASQQTTTSRSKSATQSKITDFLYQRKRHRTVESDLSSPKLKYRRQMDSAMSD